jgi:hypothetical protein
LYDPTSGRSVREGDSLFYTGELNTATLLPNGKALITGGTHDGPRAELYDPATGKFTSISFALKPSAAASALYEGKPITRTAPDTATLLKDGRVLLSESGYLETYDPSTGAFTPAGFIFAPGQWDGPTATLLADGRVLFDGELDALYDPASGPHLMGLPTTARFGQTATLLPDGSVLIAGGSSTEDAIASAELFK